jgi:hypothetical protein
MTRYEYTVTATPRHCHRWTKMDAYTLVCWGDNQRDAIDHAVTALSNEHRQAVCRPYYVFTAVRTGKRVAGVA